jgi:two-component system sensor histidine kinase PilS (NtrC family)
MDFTSRAFSWEEEKRFRKLTFMRLVVATVMVGAAIMVLQIEGKVTSMAALYSLLGVLYLSSASAYLAFRTGARFKSLVWTLLLMDLAVLTMIVHYSGGSYSFFTILYVLPILMAGIYFQLFGGLVTAALAASAYVIYGFMEFSGHLYPVGSTLLDSSYSASFMPLLRGYIHIVVFIFSGLISGYVSRRIQNKREELEVRERELKNVRLNTDSIIKNMSSGLIVADSYGEILSLNPAATEILGLDKTVMDYRGYFIDEILQHMPDLLGEIQEALEDGRPRKRHEVEVEKENGGKIILGISVSLIQREEEDEVYGAIALFQDLTEVMSMRERVRRADRMAAVGELSASIAHEIRAPLASICGSIEMLQEEIETTGQNRDLMNLIMEESDRLDAMITEFLEFARMRKPSFSNVDISSCVRDVVTLLKNSPDVEKDISFSVQNQPNIIACVDDEQIKQVFLNLGINACEAMGKCGKLEILLDCEELVLKEGSEPEECVKIEFINNGPPIPDEDIGKLFQPFFTTRDSGTGLGLATAARIVENHRGAIKVRSSRKKGTVFTVIIPQKVEESDEETGVEKKYEVDQNI